MRSSDNSYKKDSITKVTLITSLASVLIFVSAFFINVTSSETAYGRFADNISAFISQPLFIILSALTLLAPLAVWYFSNRYTKAINELNNGLKKVEEKTLSVYNFTNLLLNDDFTGSIELSGENDKLSGSLISLRDKLKTNREKDIKRREEETVRNWLVETESHFSEILRNNLNNPEAMSFMVLKDLTREIKAVQGGFYLLDDSDVDDKFFNLLSFFAFDRKKFADRKIKWGDGLIGTCALEKKTILMNNVPDKYIRVTSGLGETKPKYVMLEPMIHENTVYGVLEFASFTAPEPQHITLVNKVAASVGATLASVKTSLHTAKLLQDSKEQANILASQEEEMRQNMEELKATQEEAARQSRHLISLESSINKVLIRADFDATGKITWANRAFLDKLQYNSFREAENKFIKDFICNKDIGAFDYQWTDITGGKSSLEGKLVFLNKHGQELWFLAALTPVKDDDGIVLRIILLAMDMTEYQQEQLSVLPFIQSVERTGIMVESDIHGTISNANDNFINACGISKNDFKSASFIDLVDPIDVESFTIKWEAAVKGNEVDGTFKIISRQGDEKWLEGSLSGVYDTNRQICKVIFTGRDITAYRSTENDYRSLSESMQKYEKLLHDTEKESLKKIKDIKADLNAKCREAMKLTEKYQKLLDESNYAIVISDNENRILFFNKAAENLWKTEKQKVTDQNISVLFHAGFPENNRVMKLYSEPGIRIPPVELNITIKDASGVDRHCTIMMSRTPAGMENNTIAFLRQSQ